jgi:hypothetical protein
MPATTKKVTKAVTAKRAAKGTRSLSTAEAVRKLAKATPAGLKPIAQAAAAEARTFLAKIDAKDRADKPASKPAKPAKPSAAATKPAKAPKAATASAKPATEGAKAPTGAKGKIIAMIDASKAGVSPGEIAKALGWPRAGGTISRAIKLAPFKVAKARDAEGVLRYSRA